MKSFTNRVAAITGAGGGIGRALALELADRGCHLALADINMDGLEATREKVIQLQAAKLNTTQISLHHVDVSQKEQVLAFAKAVMDTHSQVNILINNAGITLQKQFINHTDADWERVIGINFYGVIYGCQAFLPYLRQADEAHIVNMSSMAGFLGFPTQTSYCSTKAAVKGLSESLYTELKCENIGVTSVHPGAIKTDIMRRSVAESDDPKSAQKAMDMAMRFARKPEEAARKIVAAISKNKQRCLIGSDSFIIEFLKRLTPVGSQKLLAMFFAKNKAA